MPGMRTDSYQPTSLPAPDAESLARSQTLSARIAAAIVAADGWVSFARYMEMALYTPGLGYYGGANAKFGRTPADGSDFVTAPELTPLFAQTLAAPVAQAFTAAGTREVIEFGAGTGRLAADLLNALNAQGAPCERYTIVELSGELRERQRETLLRRAPALHERVVWIDRLPTSFAGVALGNEVLDAMPVRLHARIDGTWFERGVGLGADGRFVWSDRPMSSDAVLADGLSALPGTDDYVTESHQAGAAFVATVCKMLSRGALLLLDYGFPRHEYLHAQRSGGTLMCHYRHRAHDDPFFLPGLQDITAHVDFSAMAQAGIDAGATLLGFTSQARFLINAGITEVLGQFDASDARNFLPHANAVQKLLSEAEMGELFKVIGFGRGLAPDDALLDAFAAGDRSASLLAPVGDADDAPTSDFNGMAR